MELLTHNAGSKQDIANQSSAPLEETTEFGGNNVKEIPDDLNISLTARERLLKKLQGIRTTVSTVCIVWCSYNYSKVTL